LWAYFFANMASKTLIARSNGTGLDVNLENFASYGSATAINSPRSLEACGMLGIAPEELAERDLESFAEPDLAVEFQQKRHEFYEERRRRKYMMSGIYICLIGVPTLTHCLID
jgi:hypothetical protein